jgi:hypothetical protein
MSLKTIVDAVVAQLAADTNLQTEFGSEIKKGAKRIDEAYSKARILRVYASATETRFFSTAPAPTNVQRLANINIVTAYFETDEEAAEDIKSNHDAWVRNAIVQDLSFGGTCLENTLIGRTLFLVPENISNLYFVVVPVFCQRRESLT